MEFQLHDNGRQLVCAWFALCTNGAEWTARGPVGNGEFGQIPVCERCAARVGLTDLQPYSLEFDDFCPYHDGAEFDDGEHMGLTVCTCSTVKTSTSEETR